MSDTIEVNNKKIPKACVVDSSNKKSLKTAVDWASWDYGQYNGNSKRTSSNIELIKYVIDILK